MNEQTKQCKWCYCRFTLTPLHRFGDYCSPHCYYAAKQAEKALRKSQKENNKKEEP